MSQENAPLNGIKVLEIGKNISTSITGMNLADYGADVITILTKNDAPALDPVSEAILGKNKQIYETNGSYDTLLDDIKPFIEKADILISSDSSFVKEVENKIDTNIIICSLPAFANSDKTWSVSEESIAALATMYEGPGGLGDPAKYHFPIVSYITASLAINSIMLALISREKNAQGDIIEIPHYDAAFYANFVLTMATDNAPTQWKVFQMLGSPFLGVWKTKDDNRIYLHLGLADHLDVFFSVLNQNELGNEVNELKLALTPNTIKDTVCINSIKEAKKIKEILERIILTKNADDWESLLGSNGLCCAKIRSLNEWTSDPASEKIISKIETKDYGTVNVPNPSLRFSDFKTKSIESLDKRVISELPKNWTTTKTISKPIETKPPLQGLKVLDMTRVIAGPLAGKVLAQSGAEVLHVRKPANSQYWEDVFHMELNGGKKSVALNIKDPDDKKRFIDLINDFNPDVVIQNYSNGVAEKLGLDYQSFKEKNNNIIYLHTTAYNTEGLWKDRKGFEQNIQASSGIQMEVGGKESPKFLAVLINDINTGLNGSFGVLLALFHLKRGGKGQIVKTSLEIPAVLAQIKKLNINNSCLSKSDIETFYNKQDILNNYYKAKDSQFFLSVNNSDINNIYSLCNIKDRENDKELKNELVNFFSDKTVSNIISLVKNKNLSNTVRIIKRRKLGDVIEEFKNIEKPLAERRYFESVGYATETHLPFKFKNIKLPKTSAASSIGGDTYSVLKDRGINCEGIEKRQSIKPPKDRTGFTAKLVNIINTLSQFRWILFVIKSRK